MTLSPMTLLSDKVQGPSQVSPCRINFSDRHLVLYYYMWTN